MKIINIYTFSLTLIMTSLLFSSNTFAQQSNHRKNCEQIAVRSGIKDVIKNIDDSFNNKKNNEEKIQELNAIWENLNLKILVRYTKYSSALDDCIYENRLERAFTSACSIGIKNLDSTQIKRDIYSVRKLISEYEKIASSEHHTNLNAIKLNLEIFEIAANKANKNEKFNPKTANFLRDLGQNVVLAVDTVD